MTDWCLFIFQAIVRRKEGYDKECSNIEKKSGRDKALEFGVEAQAHVNELQQAAEKELIELQQDYQSKLNKMHAQLEEVWKKQQGLA